MSEAEGTEEKKIATKNVEYDGIKIQNELLSEHLIFENAKEGNYTYIVYGNKKVYYAPNPKVPNVKYFWYDNNNNIFMIAKQKSMQRID